MTLSSFPRLFTTFAIFHDFPSLENDLPKFHDFPWSEGTLRQADSQTDTGENKTLSVEVNIDNIVTFIGIKPTSLVRYAKHK